MLKLLLSYIVFNRNIYTLMTIVKNVKMNIQAYITQLANGADLYFSDIYNFFQRVFNSQKIFLKS